MESVRIDTWLWSVRQTKTRSAASTACRGGHIEVNARPAKAATPVHVGDRVTGRLGGRTIDLEVVVLLQKRVGAQVAMAAYVDHAPPPPRSAVEPNVFERERGAGRPTKRDRRALDQLRRGREER